MGKSPNYYEILGCTHQSTEKEVKILMLFLFILLVYCLDFLFSLYKKSTDAVPASHILFIQRNLSRSTKFCLDK